ncbi:MAG: hypothetical protein H0X42_05265 [Solirubrobacterales bacterium]|nr:hypothetical protein [Solirubrobacterales bacterium]
MGGFVAQQLARRAPERVAGLALISTDPGGPEAAQPPAAVWARLIDHTGTPREQASRLISLLFPAGLAVEVDRQAGELVADARAELSTESAQAQEAAIDAWHTTRQPDSGGVCSSRKTMNWGENSSCSQVSS